MQRESRIAEAIIRNGTDERRLGVLSDLISDELNIVVSGYTKDKVIALASLTEAVGRYLADNLCDPDRPVDDVDMVLAAVEQSVYDRLTDMDGYRDNSTVFTELCREVNGHQHQNHPQYRDRYCDQYRLQRCRDQHRHDRPCHDDRDIDRIGCPEEPDHPEPDYQESDELESEISDFMTGTEILAERLLRTEPTDIRIFVDDGGHPMAALVYDLASMGRDEDTLDDDHDTDHGGPYDDPFDDDDNCLDDDDIDPDNLINLIDRDVCDTGLCGGDCGRCPYNEDIPMFIYENGMPKRISGRGPHARV